MENYVDRKEFDNLKDEVKELKTKLNDYDSLLHEIDKKIDLICQNITNSEKVEELKINPLADRVDKLEQSKTWLWRTIGAAIIGLAIKIIFDINR